jgi:hypothetical protein
MTTTTVTNIGYTGTIQNATVTGQYGVPVNAHLWGAGGGSSNASGNAGAYSKVYFVAKPGDIITVAVGQGGGRGGPSINSWTPSGFSGASYSGLLFNTRFPPPGDAPVYPYGQRFRNTTSNISSFLSQWGVWGADQNVQTFTRQYLVNFPATADVIFQMVASTYGRVYLDGNLIVQGAGRTNNAVYDDTINQAFVRVTAGNHVVRIEADGSGAPPNPGSDNPNAIGVIFGTGDQTTYAGGRGGQSTNDLGFQNGSGGGGGGATVISVNGVVIGVAAGGAGAAARPAVDASTDFRYNNGQNGQDYQASPDIYDNTFGPGGGGGGGLWAGQGGAAGGGAPRIGGAAGTNGTSLGDNVSQTVGRIPYTNSLYPGGNVAYGGLGLGYYSAGGNGAIALEYQTGGGGAVNDFGSWRPVQTTYVKDAGVWKTVKTTYINVNGIWKPIQGAPVPTFTEFYGAFAPASRSFGSRLTPPPPPPAPTYDYSSYTGYGSTDMF